MEENNREVEKLQSGQAGGTRSQVFDLMLTGLMAALVMAATSFFKVPVVATNGYIHLGDAMAFLSVIILGRRNGTIAAASGSALADLLGGYAHWAPWTFIIKAAMAFIAGTILMAEKNGAENVTAEKVTAENINVRNIKGSTVTSIIAMSAGSLVMIAGYFTVQRFMYGNWAAPFAALPGNIIQGAAGVVIAEIVSAALKKSAPLIAGAQR